MEQDKDKEEPRYKKNIRQTKNFINRYWKELLVLVLTLTSLELLYLDYPINQSGGQYEKFDFDKPMKRAGGKSILSKIASPGKKLLNTNLLNKILYGLWLLVKNLLTLLMFVFIFMAIPLIPILLFMLVMFFILRGRIGGLKQL